MSHSAFHRVAGLVFAIVAIAHAVRAIRALPLLIGTTSVPVWASWVAVAGAGGLCVWSLRARG